MNWMYCYAGKIYVKIGGQLSSLLQGTKKKKAQFGWNEEAKKAFQSIKEYLERLPQMVSPSQDEPLLLNLAISDHVVSV